MNLMKKIESREIGIVSAYESVFEALRTMKDVGIIESPDYEPFSRAVASRERLGGKAMARPSSMAPLWADMLDDIRLHEAEERAAHDVFMRSRGKNIPRASYALDVALGNLRRSQRIVEGMAYRLLLRINWGVRGAAQLTEFLREFVSVYYVLNYVEYGEIPVSLLTLSEAALSYYDGHDLEICMVVATNGVAYTRASECLERFFVTDKEKPA